MNFTNVLIVNGRIVSRAPIEIDTSCSAVTRYHAFLESLPAPCEMRLEEPPLWFKLHEVAPGAAVLIVRHEETPVCTLLILSGQAPSADEEAAISHVQTLAIRIGRVLGHTVGTDLRLVQERPLVARIELPRPAEFDAPAQGACREEGNAIAAAYLDRLLGA